MDIKPVIESDQNVDVLINDELETNISTKDATEELLTNNVKKGILRLPSGRALTIRDTYEITAAENTKTIILIGPSACGKTTIETTLYQMFQNGTLGDYYFAGSKTIQGYEQRSYYTRTKSRQKISTTPRTSRGTQETFLHLKLWNCRTDRYLNYLFADLSGEHFENHIAEIESMKRDFNFIKSADHIIAVLDGKLISDKRRRNGALEEIAQLLRTVFDAGLYTSKTSLQIVISKYDIVEEMLSRDPSIETFISRVKDEIQQRLKPYVKEINFSNVAAMPDDNTRFDIGYGIKELMDSWATPKNNIILSYRNNKRKRILSSEFDKLYEKMLGGING
jgi:adenylylsulfate kinase-like enzyme